MHAATVNAKDRFGHKSGVNTLIDSDLFDHQSVSHHIIRHCQRIGVAHIDFMLAGSHFMMGIFNTDAHFFQRDNGITAQVGGSIHWSQVEITAGIQGFCALGIFEIEKF